MRPERLSGIAAAVLIFAASADGAAALDRRVRIVNDSALDIVAFYGPRIGTEATGENLLGEAELPAGAAVILNFEDQSGYCRYTFRAVFRDGVELTRDGVNICEVGTFRYTD